MHNLLTKVRRATPEDAAQLAEFGLATWVHVHIWEAATEDSRTITEYPFQIDHLSDQIRDPQNIFLLVDVDRRLTGFAQMRGGKTFQRVTGPNAIELERFYIEPAWLGKGVALHLMLACIAAARDLGYETVWLNAWHANEHARAFYQQWRYAEPGFYTYTIGSNGLGAPTAAVEPSACQILTYQAA